MSTLKVAWENSFARRNLTGTGVYAARLLAHLRQLDGLELAVLERSAANTPATGMQRRWQTLRNLWWIRHTLPDVLRRDRFDVLHCPAFVAPEAAPCPVIITMHDIIYRLYPQAFGWWWVRFMNSMTPAVRAAAAIICGSECSQRDIVQAYSLPPERVHVIPYGVDHDRFHPGAGLDPTWAGRLGIRSGYVLHVGELSQRKNIPTLLRAVARLREQGKWNERQLVLAGSDAPGMHGADEIFRTIAELELRASVVLAGRVPDEHLPGLYANAALLVMPSVYEGFGFPVAEAMASGTPVVCSNVSSLPEVAGDAARLVPPTDIESLAAAIDDILCNAALADEMRRKGLVQAQRFDWKQTAQATLRLYQSVAR